MRIAIIGAGVSGLVAAYHLQREHELFVFEREDWAGGHACTVDVTDGSGKPLALDVGFLVYNERTYPNFSRLLREIGVPTQAAPMSFSMRCERCAREYSSHGLRTLLGPTVRHWLNVRHLRMVREILRFHQLGQRWLRQPSPNATLGAFLTEHAFSEDLRRHYVFPMTAAIWSAPPHSVQLFPLGTYLRFMENHGLLSVSNQPQWRTISGGSREYVRRLTAGFAERIFLRTSVRQIRRHARGIDVQLDHETVHVDAVVIATHSDQALRLLADPTPQEAAALSAIRYQRNEVVLHTYAGLLPRKRQLWASWNYHVADCRQENGALTMTYFINHLQSLPTTTTFCVSLNSTANIPSEHVLRRWWFEHPQFDPKVPLAQATLAQWNGHRGTYFAGAYLGYGFHEDGVRAALDVVAAIENRRAAA